MKKKIIIIGPAYPLRGGLASFNERLALEFFNQNYEVLIYTFSLQYPSILFPGKTQYSTDKKPNNININVCINSINPFNWLKIGYKLKKLKPDIIIVRFWLPFMAPCLGTIIKIVKKNNYSKIVCIADNIIPHEKRIGDKILTKYFINSIDNFITMSDKVLLDLKNIFNKSAIKIFHPLYDNFGIKIGKNIARQKLHIPQDIKIILFFGFIRKYKGLELLLNAMNEDKIKNNNITLLIAGEFYDKKENYIKIIEQYNLQSNIILHDKFIPDNYIKYYLSSADFVIQPYLNATQSGVTPLAYHFDKPMLITNVGGLPDMVPDKKCGLICLPNSKSIADGIIKLYEYGEEYFIPFLQEEKIKYSWSQLLNTIINI